MADGLREEHARLREFWSGLYRDEVARGTIFSKERLDEVCAMDESGLHDLLMGWESVCPLPIYADRATSAMAALEQEVIGALDTSWFLQDDDSPVRRPIRILTGVGGRMYAREGNGLYEVTSLRTIPGVRFVSAAFGEDAVEQYRRAAPLEANAVLSGSPLSLEVKGGSVRSPIVPDRVFPVGSADGTYHVIPVRFFRVEVDADRRYGVEWVPFNPSFPCDVPEGSACRYVGDMGMYQRVVQE